MVNKQKKKGSRWEKKLEDLLNSKLNHSEFKRTPASGALGTIVGEPVLTGDLRGRVLGVPSKIKFEAKVGYGGSTQLTVKKEWLDKIAEEAKQDYSIPMLACRFSGARQGVENFVVLDFEIFADLMNLISEMQEDLDKAYSTETDDEKDKEIKRLEGKVKFMEHWLVAESKASNRLIDTALGEIERT